MATRRSNRRRIDEPAAESTQDASAPATPAPNKRQRVSTRPFEQGVNPITPPSTVRRPSQRPSGSQRSDTEALFVREDSEVRGEDSDDSGQDDEVDPCPEVDADAEDLAAAGEGAATEALAAVDSSIDSFSEEEHEVVATVRYRASYGDIEKNPIHSAADTFAEYKVDRLSMQCIWQWVNEVIASQVNQRVNVQLASLSAELWHGKGTNKRDRPVKRLRRESLFDVRQLKDLARSIDVNTSERLCMDFNLYLTGDPITASQGVAPSPLRLSQCTVSEPNDRIKSAIMRARERSEIDKVPKQPTGWVPFEYEFWAEIMAHTDNFLEYFTAKWDVEGAEEGIQKIRDTVIRDGHIDINMLMDNSDENGASFSKIFRIN
ncbi:hypothetical protein E8E11_010430 [Didymella keratinophila]|nr:hypothetical protein E8E11_010430 [Didymella keratinophila]